VPVADIFQTVPPPPIVLGVSLILTPIESIFLAIPHTLAAIADAFQTVPSSAAQASISPILAPIKPVLTAVPDVLLAVAEVFPAIEPTFSPVPDRLWCG